MNNPTWTRQQLLAFRRGRLTDPDLEREMQEDYDTNPNSQVREFIERRRMEAMRILDPNDDCFMSILFEDDEDTEASPDTNALIIHDASSQSEKQLTNTVATAKSVTVSTNTIYPRNINDNHQFNALTRFIGNRPKTSLVAATACLMLMGYAGFQSHDYLSPQHVKQPEFLDTPCNADEIQSVVSDWSEYLNVDTEMTNSIGMSFRLIPPGELTMGSNRYEVHHQDDEFEHRVRLTRAFYISAFETTQANFEQVMGYNPSSYQGEDHPNADQRPVEQVRWFEMVDFCNRLSEMEGLSPCYRIVDAQYDEKRNDGEEKRITNATVYNVDGTGYRLPTEAEWEYCARAGTTGRWYSGPEPNEDLIATIAHIDLPGTPRETIAVGSLTPNAFGLYDTIGNVWEWVQDWKGDTYYEQSPRNNPLGPSAGRYKVIRGGSYNEPLINARVPNRGKLTPYTRDKDRGFRIVRMILQ